MSSVLSQIRRLNGLGAHAVAEPFAGGAGAALTLLYQEEAHDIYINDIDPAIHDFWWAAVHRHRLFLEMLRETPVDMDEWRRQRDIYYGHTRGRVSRLRRGFAAFYLNRCNRSGIIMGGGAIGGQEQTGAWKVDARFNKATLAERLARLGEYRDRIHVSGIDGLDFLAQCDAASTFLFIDPPYFGKGETLYLNGLDEDYHGELAARLSHMPDAGWVLTYDDCPEIRAMYEGWAAVREFGLRYAASERRSGRELLITPRWMRLPEAQRSNAIVW